MAAIIERSDNAGNTPSLAYNIGVLGVTTQTFANWVGSIDPNDYYRFTLGSTGNLRLTLTGLSADADVIVYAANGTTVLGSSNSSGSLSDTINIDNLAAGTYYARVYPGATTVNTNYSLAISAQFIDAAGNTTATARNIGTLGTTTQTFTDWVGSTDVHDYYRFTLGGTRNLRLTMAGLSADADVIVYAANGTTVLGSSNSSGSLSDTININNLAAGTYYARVYPGATTANTNYSLGLSAQFIDAAGNTTATARNIGTLGTTTQTFTDWVGSTDVNDYYRFTLADTRSMRLTLSGMSADADIALYTNNGALLARSSNIYNSNESIETSNLAAGTYYARVSQFDGDTNYNFSLTTTPAAGPILITALPVAQASVRQGFNGSFSHTHGGDIWSIDFANTGNALAIANGVVVFAGNNNDWAGNYVTARYTVGVRSFYATYAHLASVATTTEGGATRTLRSGDVITPQQVLGVIGSSGDGHTTHLHLQIGTEIVGSYASGTNDLRPPVYFSSMINADGVPADVINGTGVRFGDIFGTSTRLSDPANTFADRLWGTDDINERIFALEGNDDLQGRGGNDELYGGRGNDTLLGGTGNDTLTGGTGADIFRFVTPTGNGVDSITDFQSGTDKIQVVSPNFANIPVGTLATNRFVAAGTSLTNSNAVFIYNSTTGGLSFDRDGNGSAAAVQIATLTGHPTLRASDFQVVAA